MSDDPAPPPPVPGWPPESAQRLAKAEELRALGVEPYPTRYERTHSLGEIVAAHGDKSLEELAAQAVPVRVAGRVLTKRGHGKASFATLSDGASRLQVYVRQDEVGERGYRLLDLVDLGDFLGVAGVVMRTRKGELSVQASELTFLSKALLPPPEKWHGLADVELRYRQRHLDLLANPEVRRAFLTRSALVAELRRFLEARGYVEVETPMMQSVPGGAVARPFVTHHNALGIDLYLRIAPELYLKRLVVGGLERVYELNRNFRNEGIDSQHNPEFTMLEFYTAYADCRDVMAITEELLGAAAERVLPGGAGEYRDRATGQLRTISFARPFRRQSMLQAVAESAAREGWGVRPEQLGDDQGLRAWLRSDPASAPQAVAPADWAAARRQAGDERLSHGTRIALLFDALVSPKLWEPTFVTDYPVEVSPLAKKRADDARLTDRFELFAAGMEIANGFSELNDPLDQRERFLQQLQARERTDQEAHPMDEDYVKALGHGLPPTGGCGVGIDRLAMILTGSSSIRDVILFPHMRPEGGRSAAGSGEREASEPEPG